MTEETVTKLLLCWLENNGWEIICYDFPQSGTGICLHPNPEFRTTKNKDSFIPDIVAYKNGIVVFFENKDRFVLDDFIKVERLRDLSLYSHSIGSLLKEIEYQQILYGIGLPFSERNADKCNSQLTKVDFVLFCEPESSVVVLYDPFDAFHVT